MATQASLASRNALISRHGAGSALARVTRPVGVRRVVNSRQAVQMAATVSWGAMSAEALSALPDGDSALKTLVGTGGCEVEAGSGVYQLGNRAHYKYGALKNMTVLLGVIFLCLLVDSFTLRRLQCPLQSVRKECFTPFKHKANVLSGCLCAVAAQPRT